MCNVENSFAENTLAIRLLLFVRVDWEDGAKVHNI